MEVLDMLDRFLESLANKTMKDFLSKDSIQRLGKELEDAGRDEMTVKLYCIQELLKQRPQAKVTKDDKYRLSPALVSLLEIRKHPNLLRRALELINKLLTTQR